MKKIYLAIFSLILFAATGFTQTQTVTYNTPGTYSWVAPCGVTSVKIQCWGAGAGGSNGIGGGGGGAFAGNNTLAVVPGTIYTITVGGGSAAGAGDPGDNSSFNSLVVAEGGGNFTNTSVGGRASASIGAAGLVWSGGSGGNGTGTGGGGGGGSAGAGGAGGAGAATNTTAGGIGGIAGIAGSGIAGAAGGNGGANNGNGVTGSFPGAGGGERGNPGGAIGSGGGGNGQVIITYTGTPSYCIPDFETNVEPITNVTFAGIVNSTSGTINGPADYELFCTPAGTVMQGSATNAISVSGNTNGNRTDNIRVYIDWDQNGVFGNVANEIYDLPTITNGTSATSTSNIAVPAGATLGTTQMRVMKRRTQVPTDPCLTGAGNGQAEDYLLTVTTPATITTGTITGSPFCAGSTVSVSFTSTGTYSGNTYTAQLSNVAGSFAAPISIGTLVSNANLGTITATIPAATPTGAGYRIRVVSNGPAVNGADNGVNITVTALPVATFSYTSTPYCKNAANPSPTFSGGGVAGTFTASPTGLSITAATGQINLSASTAGTYTVTNTIAAAGGCGVVTATSSVTITALPVATFSYAGTPYCKTAANPSPAFSGGGVAGNFTASPAGLSITAATGQINLSASTSGTYTVTNTIAAAAGCGVVTATSSVTITTLPVATFSYTGTPYCQNAANPSPAFSGSGVAGNFTASPAGLSITAATGQINLSASTAGTYTVTNTIAAAGGCAVVTATSSVTITALPVATFSYTGTPYCQNAANPSPAFSGGGGAGNFTASPAGLSITAATGQINLSASTAGTYTVTNTIAASGGCAVVTATSSVTITALPVATFSYTGTPYCQTAANPSPAFSGGGVAGIFTASPAGLSITAATGQINLSASTAGTYTVTNTIAALGGCALVTATSSVTITALPVATFSYAATPYCQDGVNPSPTFSGGGVAGTFSSTTGLVFVSTTTGQINLSASTAGTYTVTNTIAALGGCVVVTATSSVTINQPVVITSNPTPASSIICTNGSINYTVTATGSNLTYNWFLNGNPISNGGDFSGANTATLHITGADPTDAGNYTVTVSGSAPCTSVTSTPVSLTVNQNISFTTPPPVNTTLCQGQTFIISTSVSGTVTTYQWYKNGVAYTPGTFDGINTYTLTIPAITIANAGSYKLFVDDGTGTGCPSAFSSTAVLNVNVTSIGGTTSGAITVCSGTNSGSVTLSGNTGAIVRWESSVDNFATTTTIANTTTTQNYTNLTQTTQYRAVVQSGVCPSDNSTVTQITVNPVIDNNAVAADQTICAGSTPAGLTGTTPTGGSGTYTYLWESSVTSATAGFGAASGTNNGQNYTPGALTATTWYRRTVISGPCANNVSTAIQVTVNPVIGNNSVAADQTICTGLTPAGLTGTTPTGGGGTYTYLWESSTISATAGFGAASGTNNGLNYTPGVLTATTWYRRTVISGPCANNVSTAIQVTVNPVIGNNTIAADQTICTGSTPAGLTGTIPTGGSGTYTYLWESSTTSATAGFGAAGGTNNGQNYTPGVLTATTWYRRTVISGPCTNNVSTTIQVTINPVIGNNTVAAAQTICTGSTPAGLTGTTPTGGGGTYTYLWESSTTSATAGFAAASGTNNGQNYTPGALTATTWYRRTVISGPCVNNVSTAIQVTVNALIGNNTVAADQTICTGSTPAGLTGTTPTGGGGSYTYLWESSTTSATAGFATAGGISNGQNYASGALTATTWYRRTVISGPCLNNVSTTIQVTINPVIGNNTVAAAQTICTGSIPAGLTGATPTGGSGTYTYLWESSITSATAGFAAAGGTNNGQNYTPGVLTATTWYRRTVISGPCANIVSTAIQVTVNPVIGNNTVAAVQTICTGSTPAGLTGTIPTGGGGAYTYLWESSVTSATAGFSAASGTNNGQNYTPGVLTATTWYRRTVISGPCANNVSTAIQVTVNPLIGNNTVAAVQTICSGSTPAGLTGTIPTGGGGTYTYLWESSTTSATAGFTTASGTSNGQNYTPGALTATTWYRRTVTSGGCTDISTAIQVTVNPVIGNNTVAAVQTICTGSTPAGLTGTTPTGGNSTYTYLWESSTTSATAGFTTASGTSNGQNYTPGVLTATTWYRRTVLSGPCTNTSTAIQVTVNPVIGNNAIAADQSICTGSTPSGLTGTNPTGGNGAYNFLWESSTTSATAGFAAASGTNNGKNYTPATLTQTTWYRRTVISGPCTNNVSTTIQVTVNPLPTITTTGIATPKCFSASGQTSTLAYTATTQSPTTYSINWTGLTDVTDATLLASSITIPIPASKAPGTYTGTLTVKNANGCVSTNVAVSVTINPLPVPTLTNNPISPVCANTNVTYTTDASQTNYVWTFSGVPGTDYIIVSGGNSTSNTAVITWKTPGNKTVTVNYTNGNTCTAVTPTSNSITVLAVPTGTFTETDNSGTANNDKIICAGASATFTFSVSGINSYIFKVNGLVIQSGTSNIFSSSILNDGDNVTVDIANASNCGATFGPILMTVKQLPTPILTVTENSGVPNNNTICPNDPLTLTTPANTGSTYSFIINGSTVSTGTSNTYTTTAITTTSTVAIMETNSNGCQATTANQTVTASPVPSGTLTVSPGASFCAGTTVTFTAPAVTGNTYNFINGSTSVQNSTSNTYTTTTLANGDIVTVVVTNASGCSATLNAIAVTVNPPPTGTLNAFENSGVQNDNNICANAPVTFTFSNTTYSGYNFKVNGVSKQNNGTASYTNSALASGDIVTVVVTSGSGCVATFTAPTITIAPSPSVTLAASPTTICAGDNVTFTATPLDPTYNYNFQVNGATVQNGSANTYSSTSIVSTDVITVDVTNSNACTTTSNAVSVPGTPLPTVVTNNQTVCAPATVDLTAPAVTSGSTPGLSFSYFTDAGGTLVYSTPATAGAGTYYIKGTTAGGCSAISPVTVTVNPLPVVAAITPAGPISVCKGNTIALSDPTTGGVWSSLNTGIATIDALGVVTGVSAGTATINYIVTNITTGCNTTVSATVTVNAPPTVAPITGNFNVCTGSTSQLSDITSGGTWISGNTGVATVDASGLVTGVAPGNEVISYSFTDLNGCTTVVTTTVTVANSPTVAAITPATPNICVGGTISLSDATTGGVWSSGTTTVATITSAGIVTGVAGGTSVITYTIITSCGGTASSSTTVTVNAPPTATIAYSGSPFCTSSAPVPVVQTGTTGGTYSASPSGLSLAADGTITPSTSTAGAYTVTYTIAASGGCAIFTTTATVTITAAPSATIAYGASPYCSNSGTATITRTGTAGGTYTKTTGAGTLSLNSTTGDITLGTSTPGLYTVTYTVAASGGCAIFTTTASITITAAPSATIAYSGSPYCSNGGTATVTRTGTVGGSYTKTAGAGTLSLNASTGDIILGTSTPGIYTVTYTVAASAGCAIYTTTANVTITAAPTAVAGSNFSTCSNNPPVNVTSGSSATNYSSVVWSSSGTGSFANQGNLTTTTYTPSAGDILAGSVTLTLKANGNGSCAAATSTKILTISPPPPAFVLTPSGTVNVCQGNVQPLTATGTAPTTGSVTISSGNINLNIPDDIDLGPFGNYPQSVTTNLNVSTVPAGAVINSMSVNFNITHTYDNDLVLNLKAPNGSVLNLVNQEGASGANFTNTTVSSISTNPFLNVATSAPFNGIFVADGVNGVGTPNSSTNAFSNLFSTPNGIWKFGAEDDVAGDVGKLLNWSITINYTIPGTTLVPAPVWTPITDLYTDAGATVAYTGTGLATVYAKPSTSGSKIYTATVTNAANCSTSQNVTLNVGISPIVTVTADYCAVAGKVQLTANSTPAATSYLWSTGDATQTILVDVSGIFTVTVYSAGSTCPGKGTINVANELITNGNFEAGNVAFTSAYPYRTGAGSLNSPPGYAVDTAANYYGPTFLWGKDHTTTHGKFMMVNGATGANYQIWQQTVSVLPNTTYYFSAWGLELDNLPNNPFPPFQAPANAQLQFNVGGTQVGTLGNLPRPVNPTRDQDNNTWVRFYGSWTSGPTTTSVLVSITDLQGAVYGNNFGLDDISFGTLSTFVQLVSAPGTDAQTVCANNPITNIVYSAGSSASSPTVTGLPTGVTPSWNGIYLTISGTPTVAGTYAYTVTTTGSCQPASASGTITVQGQKITLSSGSSSPTVCTNSPVNIGYTLSGTATSATATGLAAAGLTLTVAGTTTITATITGTPSVAGSYPYTITTTGTCTPATISGTITVQSQTLTLNSGNNTQTVCINSPIANIQYTVGAPANNASVNILPAGSGLAGSYAGGLFVISGSPTVAGTFNYTVTTSGTSCTPATATGTITVTPAASLTLTSAAGTNAQTVCKPNPITPVTYSIKGGTGAAATGLPAGVTGSPSGGVFTISGTPTAAPGTYNYTVTTSGGCGAGTATGSITIQAPTVTLTSGSASPSVCINVPMPTNIVYTIGGTATGAGVTGLPGGVGFVVAGNVVTISGTPNAAGPFTYTITTTGGTCTQATATGTITVIPTAIGGSLTSVSICSGTGGTLNLTGNSSNPIRWEYSTDGGTTWTTVANTTISLTTPALTAARIYRAVVGNSCGNVFSTVATVGIHNLWVGGTSNDWNTASNWSDGQVPTPTPCPTVTIPVVTGPNVYPVLSTGAMGTITNLVINLGASLTITGNTLQIAGTIANGGTFMASNGTIELNGSSPQTIPGSAFTGNLIKDLIISNDVSLGGPESITENLSFGSSNKAFTTNNNLTLKSSITGTASVDKILSGNSITGNVTVERYIATGPAGAPNHAKSWQLLAIPTTGETINQAWQEGATMSDILPLGNPVAGSAGNPNTGFGTMITSDLASATTLGFDGYTQPGPSMKVFNPLTNGFDGPVNTSIPIYNIKGYYVFVRGDRSITLFNQGAIPTILRTKGMLFTPANPPNSTNVGSNAFESVGNPYASALDMRNIGRTANVSAVFQLWDPRLGGGYNYGAYQTFIQGTGGNYFVTPGGGSYGSTVTPYNFIQSGQAFIVQTTGGTGIVSFTENSKAAGSALFSRPADVHQVQQSLRTDLYNAAGTELIDGVLNQFDDSYSNGVDGLDARKSHNTGENLAIKTAGTLLVIERRHTLTVQDTIFLNLTGVRVQQYQFRFSADNITTGGLEGFLEDNYLHTKTPVSLSGSTVANFSIENIAGSYAADRFRIVFTPSVVLPVTFTSIKAYRQDKDIDVEWRVENEMNMKQYVVEKSVNGTQFTTLVVKAATANGGRSAIYVTTDVNAPQGYNYYRVRSVDINGKTAYTNVVKVLMGSSKQDITIVPNPITDGMIHLQLMNQPEGKYGLRLLDKLGQVIVSRQISHAEGSSTELIKWNYNLAHGMYQLEVTKPDGSIKDINVLY